MNSDELSGMLDDAFPSCPRCREQLEDASDGPRAHLVCRHYGLAVMVPGRS